MGLEGLCDKANGIRASSWPMHAIYIGLEPALEPSQLLHNKLQHCFSSYNLQSVTFQVIVRVSVPVQPQSANRSNWQAMCRSEQEAY